jgi:hypothetical protein
MIMSLHPDVSMLAFFQATQLNLFERFLTQAVAGIDSTSITAGMQNVAYVALVIGFLWQVYQSALHGGDVRGLGTSLIKYVVTAVVVMNYHAIFTTLNQGFVNAGNWIGSASGGLNLLDNWMSDLKTQYSQDASQKMWGLITGSMAGLIDGILILVAYILYPVVIVIFGFFYILYGSILYIFGPIVIALMPLGATNRLAKSYVENVFIWNAWPVLYGGFGALLSAVQMGQLNQMLSQNDFLGGLGNLEASFLIGFASIIYSLAIAVIPFMAKKIVSGEVGATAGTLIGAAATALTAGAAAVEGATSGAAAAGGASANTAAPTGSSAVSPTGGAGQSGKSPAASNQPAPPQQSPGAATTRSPGTGGSDQARSLVNDSFASTSSTKTPAEANSNSGPTVEGHAEQIRGSFGDAMGPDKADAQKSDGVPAPAGGSVSASLRRDGAGTKSKSTGSSSASAMRAPNVRREGLATWGAYHAARLAAHGAVAGGGAIGRTGKAAYEAVTNPVGSSGKVGSLAGQVSGTVANSAENAAEAFSAVGQTIAHPIATAKSGAAAIGNRVSDAASQVANMARRSVNEAQTKFSEAYGDLRRSKEPESDQE